MKIIKSLCILLFVVICPSYFYAQTTLLNFKIVDVSSQEPVAFCSIVVKGTQNSAQTNEQGEFNINASFTDTLIVYQLGYFTKKECVNSILKNNGTIFLNSKNISLNEIVVRYKQNDTLQANNNIVFLDFEFYDDFILALVDKGRRYNSLLLLDLNGNKITEKQLYVKTEILAKDCFDNIHVLTNDSSYQVYYNYQSLVLLSAYSINRYNDVLKPCQCFYGDNFVFKIKHYKQLKNTYVLYTKNPKSKKSIACVADSEAIKGFNMDYDINYFLEQRRNGLGYRMSVPEIKEKINALREDLVLKSDYANLLRPVESEMKKVNTLFVLFNYSQKLIQTYTTTGDFVKTDTLNQFNDIQPKLYFDDDTQKIIFSKTSKGILTLFQFDIKSNKLTHKFILQQFNFVTDFKIKGNYLYFIHKDKSTSLVKSKIIKELISWQVF